MWLVDLNDNFACDWLIELSDNKLSDNKLCDNKLSDNKLSDNKLSDNKLSDNKLSDNKLSDNNLAGELVENRSFFKPITIKEIVTQGLFMINSVFFLNSKTRRQVRHL